MSEDFQYSFSDLPEIIKSLKERLNIAVIYGGNKESDGSVMYRTGNPRSWKSYESVARDIQCALENTGFRHVHIFSDDMSLLDNLKKNTIHFVWLNTGGMQGYIPTSHAAAMLEMAGIPYVGHNPLNAAILDNKHMFKYMLEKIGVHTSPFVVWSRSSLSASSEADRIALRNVFGDYTGPFVIKPTSGRASLNIYVADDLKALAARVDEVYRITQNIIVIEKYLPGAEYCVSICGPVMHCRAEYVKNKHPFAFSVLERVLEEGERIFTSMDQKPITEERVRKLDLVKEGEVAERLIDIAGRIYTGLFLETLVRVDLRQDERGRLCVLEANPKPDLKRPAENVTNLTCVGLADNHMEYEDLILSIFADRLDYLLTYRRNNIQHIVNMLQ